MLRRKVQEPALRIRCIIQTRVGVREGVQSFGEPLRGPEIAPSAARNAKYSQYSQHRFCSLLDVVGEIDVRQIAIKIQRRGRETGSELVLSDDPPQVDDDL